ncbi:hypothetical protein Krad_1968 [Kineococcus radiotolerans SRS30216 = ATCC BAA-149]|uniref:Uncharacterized protein n=1 Tax=Kineococcus radiotolerans (strain ATCC BAA-149 / DSM 14245 / SRS30216) TaxID=266940 RepID=A6W9G5_KINRD|nr:hypothetical protein Krad_1968 [Kineococcus radiotolerans SRS30216 = ATCC BAA-149]
MPAFGSTDRARAGRKGMATVQASVGVAPSGYSSYPGGGGSPSFTQTEPLWSSIQRTGCSPRPQTASAHELSDDAASTARSTIVNVGLLIEVSFQ